VAVVVIDFIVPGHPQGKGRPKIVKIGGFSRMATPTKTVAYEGLVAFAAKQALAGRPAFDGPVDVTMHIRCPIPASWSQKKQRMALSGEIRPTTKPDVDNIVKAIFDGCNGVLWRDDVQVCDLRLTKRYSADPGVTVEAFEVVAPAQQVEIAAVREREVADAF
jgi:Holliday junction resolvase RusA-like endonuclease